MKHAIARKLIFGIALVGLALLGTLGATPQSGKHPTLKRHLRQGKGNSWL